MNGALEKTRLQQPGVSPSTFSDWGGWLTVPNLLSFSRLPLGLVIFYLVERNEVSVVIVSVAAVAFLSDWLDGFIARRIGPTARGAVIDPLCDKFFFAVVGLAYYEYLDKPIFWLLVSVEAFIVLSVAAASYGIKTGRIQRIVDFRSNPFGKFKFGFECAALSCLILGESGLANILFSQAIILAVLSAAMKYSDYCTKQPG